MSIDSLLRMLGPATGLALLLAGDSPTLDTHPPDGAKLDHHGRPATHGWTALFNGKDLAGFKYQPQFWKAAGGLIQGSTPGGPEHHYMYTDRADFADFELHADVKLVGNNSGICIRIAPTSFDDVPGYQVDMGDGYWGCLWEERGRGMIAKYPKEDADLIVHAGDWNHYYVRAAGHHIETWLNGFKTVDVVDEVGRSTGPIGFQLCHGDKPTAASFKNLYIRALRPHQE